MPDRKNSVNTAGSSLAKNGNVTPVSSLVCALGSEHGLMLKTLHAHWNAKGSRFLALHEFTDKRYHEILEQMDEIAERLRALDALAPSEMIALSGASVLREDHLDFFDAAKLARHLADCHHEIERTYSSFIHKLEDADPVTADFFTGLAAGHGKVAWMYKALID